MTELNQSPRQLESCLGFGHYFFNNDFGHYIKETVVSLNIIFFVSDAHDVHVVCAPEKVKTAGQASFELENNMIASRP